MYTIALRVTDCVNMKDESNDGASPFFSVPALTYIISVSPTDYKIS